MKKLTITIFALGLLACQKQDLSNKPLNLRHYQPFKDQSVFYRKIPPNAEADPNSDIMVQSLIDQAGQAFLVAVKEWTVAVYFADETTPRHDVKLTAGWAPKSVLLNVPVPDFAEPDPEDDGSMVIINEAEGCVYDFWQMRYRNGKWKASWGNALPLGSDGIFPKGLSARGSGFELLQGLIWPQELIDKSINHALIFSYDHTKAGGPVAPATESDGTSTEAWAIPEGALVQLDPGLDLTTLGLNDYEMTIARALQEYGMYCADDGGGLQLYAVNPISARNNPYADVWGDQTYIFLDKIPVARFRVLRLGPQLTNDVQLVANGCNNFE